MRNDCVDEAPDEFICPITLAVMRDPVVLSDGFTYERGSLAKWLEVNNRSPSTNEILEHKMYFPNRNLSNMISRWREEHGLSLVSTDLHARSG